jgi:hypothetical protein
LGLQPIKRMPRMSCCWWPGGLARLLLVRAASTAASSSSDTPTRPHAHTLCRCPLLPPHGPFLPGSHSGSIDLSRSTTRACLVSLTHFAATTQTFCSPSLCFSHSPTYSDLPRPRSSQFHSIQPHEPSITHLYSRFLLHSTPDIHELPLLPPPSIR